MAGIFDAAREALAQKPAQQPGDSAGFARGLVQALQEMRATPRNPVVGWIADALTMAHDYAQRPDQTMPTGKANPALAAIANIAAIGSLAATADRMSYGESLTNIGKANVPLLRQETADSALALAPIAFSALSKTSNAAMTYAARSAKMRVPPAVKEVGFWDEYKAIQPGAASGQRPMVDIDGRPIDPASIIAGRNAVDGPSVGLGVEDLARIIRALGIQSGPAGAKELGKDAGRYVSGGGTRAIVWRGDLADEQVPHVLAHEVGHAIDDIAGAYSPALRGGAISPAGQSKALARVYDDLNSPLGPSRPDAPRITKQQYTPEADKYPASQHGAERMAEALRAYLQNPAYIKTVEPGLAAKLRKAVNEDPNLRRVITLNSAAGAGIAGASLAASESPEGM